MGKGAKPSTMNHYTTTRETYKAVKRYDHQQFDDFCTRVYESGYRDGYAAGQHSVKGVEMEDVLAVIGDIKGVGPALSGRIKRAIEAQFAGDDGKEEKKGGKADGE